MYKFPFIPKNKNTILLCFMNIRKPVTKHSYYMVVLLYSIFSQSYYARKYISNAACFIKLFLHFARLTFQRSDSMFGTR